MPNRIIRESICSSENFNQNPLDTIGFWALLLTAVDDFGRMDSRPAIVKGRCFPLRPDMTEPVIEQYLTALQNTGLLFLYNVGERRYLELANWAKYNRLRAKTSKYPAPGSNCNQMPAHADGCQQTSSYSDSDSDSESDSESDLNNNVVVDKYHQIAQNLLESSWPAALGAIDAVAQAVQTDGEAYILAQIAYSRQRASSNPGKYLTDAIADDWATFRGQVLARAKAAKEKERQADVDQKRQEAENEAARLWSETEEGRATAAIFNA